MSIIIFVLLLPLPCETVTTISLQHVIDLTTYLLISFIWYRQAWMQCFSWGTNDQADSTNLLDFAFERHCIEQNNTWHIATVVLSTIPSVAPTNSLYMLKEKGVFTCQPPCQIRQLATGLSSPHLTRGGKTMYDKHGFTPNCYVMACRCTAHALYVKRTALIFLQLE